MQSSNIYNLFRSQAAKYGERPAFYTRSDGEWRPQSWRVVEEKVLSLACAFLAKGLTRGSSVAILAGNIPEWTICDLAAIAAGGVGVGIYPTSSSEQASFIIGHSDAEFVIVDTIAQFQKIDGEFPKVRGILCIEDGTFDAFLNEGRAARSEQLANVGSIGAELTPDDTAIMVYTSGTTGDPKGAMLSHRYILNSVDSLTRSVPIFEDDTALSYLPGCHVAERISGIYNRLNSGATAYFVDDLSRLYEYMLEVKPTVFASLPRFFEKVHASLLSEPGAIATGLPAQKVKDAFGGKVRLLTSGGAPLPAEIADFFEERGLPILQAYGLTENICVAFNTVEHHMHGTVGRPMPMCEVRIASDGEIEVKSPMMFSGYYKEPKKTAEMFTDDGWLKTGDLGSLDDEGFLKITGRKKEIIVLSNGKNVAPALVENLVKESHLISHAYVHGDGHSYCVALITINAVEAANLNSDEIYEQVSAAVAKANARLSNSEQIKRFEILDHDFAAETEVTPTMKLKRNAVAANYRDRLEKLYEN